ncbi:MAG TPA: glycosyltransferase, partial [Acidobacteriota bacterium]
MLPGLLSDGNPLTMHADYKLFQKHLEPSEEELRHQTEEWQSWPFRPLLNIVTAVCSPPLRVFEETIRSVLNQTYGGWLWTIVDASADDSIWKILTELAQRDLRVRPIRLEKNHGISRNTNVALERAEGDYIVLLDHDDQLAPHALYSVAEVVLKHPEVDFIYSDADKLDESGHRCEPLFKPDWSPEMMLSFNLLSQLSVFKRRWLDLIGYLNPELDGAQDWDLFLRITEKTRHVFHIPRILYHWRKISGSTASSAENKSNVRQAQIDAVTNHLVRTGIQEPLVEFDFTHSIYRVYPRVKWKPSKKRLISIIIPTKDQSELLRKCLDSLF